jgi:hypothetical protein
MERDVTGPALLHLVSAASHPNASEFKVERTFSGLSVHTRGSSKCEARSNARNRGA